MIDIDLLDRRFTAEEAKLFAAYQAVKELEAMEIAPCAASNVRVALAALGIAVTDLGLTYEHLADHGC
ncbi:hypothetical protein Rhow_008536 [Rhodococcus wratislaviensis]|uniref:Uncharacterized protein n=1 Tax=Rhodococcus wratislaviensis TaxID=44752 RepID=A0A402CL31_RHOWR|nr:hypothetical protein [Rhodococcus wratislaviensis]GCE44238.1 hypothetical protein Rhow_008536 [Rhodococcus wratislaviensis]